MAREYWELTSKVEERWSRWFCARRNRRTQQLFYLQENKGCDDIIGHVKIIPNARPVQGKPFQWKHDLQRETHTQKARSKIGETVPSLNYWWAFCCRFLSSLAIKAIFACWYFPLCVCLPETERGREGGHVKCQCQEKLISEQCKHPNPKSSLQNAKYRIGRRICKQQTADTEKLKHHHPYMHINQEAYLHICRTVYNTQFWPHAQCVFKGCTIYVMWTRMSEEDKEIRLKVNNSRFTSRVSWK